jgi:hypothetical protein
MVILISRPWRPWRNDEFTYDTVKYAAKEICRPNRPIIIFMRSTWLNDELLMKLLCGFSYQLNLCEWRLTRSQGNQLRAGESVS